MKNIAFFACFLVLFIPASILRIKKTFFVSDRKSGVKREKWTFSAAILGYYLTLIFAVIEFFFKASQLNYPVSLIGFLLGFFGFSLTLSAIITLGANWSLAIEFKDTGEMITWGPYKYIRHPYYLGVIFELLGVSLYLNSYYTIVFLLTFQMPIIVIRTILEEKILILQYGNAYINYKKKVRAIIPHNP